MMKMNVKFTDRLQGWMKLLPVRFRRAEKVLQGEAQKSMPEPRSEGEAAVMAAMGWNESDWEQAVTRSMNEVVKEL
jgi:hypothetical protein